MVVLSIGGCVSFSGGREADPSVRMIKRPLGGMIDEKEMN